MSRPTAVLALAVLQSWVERIAGGTGLNALSHLDPEDNERVARSAWLVQGRAGAPISWPSLDLTRPLTTIFSRIQLENASWHPYERYLPRALFDVSQRFPVAEAEIDPIITSNLQANIQREAAAIAPGLPLDAQIEALLYVLQRNASSLPSPVEAVSLYDFARTQAAVVAALGAADAPLFLMGGDISGIQSFIYTLTAAGATKSLRGRSFYLQLLTEGCARYLLRAAGLSYANLLYAGGGRFYLLLPSQIDGVPVLDWLEHQRAAFDHFFLRYHQAELYLALGGAPVPQASLLDAEAFRATWGAATEHINTAKRRRFSALGDALVDLFAPQGHGGNEDDACTVCGYQGDEREFVTLANGTARRICALCNSFEELARHLHNADYLFFEHYDTAALPTNRGQGQRQGWAAILQELGITVQIKRAPLNTFSPSRSQASLRWISALTIDVHAPHPNLAGPAIYGYRPVANTTPTVTEADRNDWQAQGDDAYPPETRDIKPFGLMVTQSRGVKRLGVLRMDVDDLGDLFRFQLDSGLAQVAALSTALGLFFEGWVGFLCERINDPAWRLANGFAQAGSEVDTTSDAASRGSVYCIYSGGDDLFIVGSWHLLLDLARRISDDLSRYSGYHPSVHVSAGLSMHTAKFPLYQAAASAEHELRQAKQRPKKAALGWLGQIVPWSEISDTFQLKRQLYDAVRPRESGPYTSRALFQTCQTIYTQYIDTLRNGKMFYGPWLWRAVYQFNRIERSLKKDNPARAQIETIRTRLLDGAAQPPHEGLRFIERLGLAARWAELELRKEQVNATREQ